MKKRQQDINTILRSYDEGYQAFMKGKKYHAPDNVLLRRAYAMGYEDALGGTRSTEEEILEGE